MKEVRAWTIHVGDTGPQGDPQGHGQDLRTLLGKMIRIDVDHEEAGLPYAIPHDNPLRDRAGARPEIWASIPTLRSSRARKSPASET